MEVFLLIDRLFSSEGCGLIDVRGTMVSWHFFLLLNDLLVSPLLVWFLSQGKVELRVNSINHVEDGVDSGAVVLQDAAIVLPVILWILTPTVTSHTKCTPSAWRNGQMILLYPCRSPLFQWHTYDRLYLPLSPLVARLNHFQFTVFLPANINSFRDGIEQP